MTEFIVDPEDWPIEEIIKDQAYFDAAIRYAEEQGYSDLVDAVHGLKARLKLSKVTNDVLKRRGAELERHNELLRAVVVTMRESYNLLSDYAGELPDKVFLGVVSGYFLGATIAVDEAIDGGALDGEK